jgi:sugar O-acyltransferase (sialic acid O-acetyltransferase NeuD family)
MQRIAILGASGHGKVVADIFRAMNDMVPAGFIADAPSSGTGPLGLPVLGAEADLSSLREQHGVDALFVAIGDNWTRHLAVERLKRLAPDLPFAAAIHPSAAVAPSARIGQGAAVMAGAVVNPDATINDFAIVNTLASVDHDASVGAFASLAPNSSMGGGARLGDFSALGQSAAIIHGVDVGVHTVVGAGAAVLRYIPSRCVAYHTPAQRIRSRQEGDPYLCAP